MTWSFVALGANLGSPLETILSTIEALKELEGVEQFQVSSLYETTPVGGPKQPNYINAVCGFLYTQSLFSLFHALRALEIRMGRARSSVRNEPRAIDLDLLFFGETTHYSPELILPHPRWHERLFVLHPLQEISEKIPLPFQFQLDTLLSQFKNTYCEQIQPIGDPHVVRAV